MDSTIAALFVFAYSPRSFARPTMDGADVARASAALHSPSSLVHGLENVMLYAGEPRPLAVFECSGYVFPQPRPVLLDRQDIVRALFDDPARGLLPEAHGVDGRCAAFDLKRLEWITFFLEGVRQTAELAVSTARRLTDMFDGDQERIIRIGRAANSALRVQQALKERPVATLPALCERTGLTFPTVSSALNRLIELGIVREATGAARNRIFVYDRFLSVLNGGTAVD